MHFSMLIAVLSFFEILKRIFFLWKFEKIELFKSFSERKEVIFEDFYETKKKQENCNHKNQENDFAKWFWTFKEKIELKVLFKDFFNFLRKLCLKIYKINPSISILTKRTLKLHYHFLTNFQPSNPLFIFFITLS